MSRSHLYVVLLLAHVLGACASDTSITQVILVRHAEKVDQSKDPELSPAGEARARLLAKTVRRADVRAIYATQFKRTQATVRPLADATGIALTVVEAGDTAGLAARIRRDHRGQVVLVAAHSNTIPALVQALGAPPIEPLADDAYDNVFIVTISGSGQATVLRLGLVMPEPPN